MLHEKFHRSTYDEFTQGIVDISECSQWEYNELKEYLLTTYHYGKYRHNDYEEIQKIASQMQLQNGIWTQKRNPSLEVPVW